MSDQELLSTAPVLDYATQACSLTTLTSSPTSAPAVATGALSGGATVADAIPRETPSQVILDALCNLGASGAKMMATASANLPSFEQNLVQGILGGVALATKDLLKEYLRFAYDLFDFLEELKPGGPASIGEELTRAFGSVMMFAASVELSSENAAKLAEVVTRVAEATRSTRPGLADLLLHLASIGASTSAATAYFKLLADPSFLAMTVEGMLTGFVNLVALRADALALSQSPSELGEALGTLLGRMIAEVTYLVLGF